MESNHDVRVPVVALGVILLMVYQTFPSWVQTNIEVQRSLMHNLEKQTDNIERQSQNIATQINTLRVLEAAVREIQQSENDKNLFRQRVCNDHEKQMAEHSAMVSALEAISRKLNEGS